MTSPPHSAPSADAAKSSIAGCLPGEKCWRYSQDTGVGHEMLNAAGEPGPHHLLRRQQRQNREHNDAAPGEDA